MIGPRKVDKPLVLYGKGKLGKLAKEVFDRLEIPVFAWIDNKVVYDYAIHIGNKDVLVANCVAIDSAIKIESYLRELCFIDIVPVWDIIEAYPEVGLHNGWFATETLETLVLGKHEVFNKLRDSASRKVFDIFYHYRVYRTPYEHVSERERSDYECLDSTLKDIMARRAYDPLAIQYIYDTQADNYHVDIHAEGNEMGLLFTHIDVIKKYRPFLKVACYHSEDGLWRIPRFLMTRLENYRFEFKLYAYQGQAAFLYCTPEEKL